MAVIKHMALNLLQLAKAQMKRQSIKRLRKMTGLDNSILSYIVQQKLRRPWVEMHLQILKKSFIIKIKKNFI